MSASGVERRWSQGQVEACLQGRPACSGGARGSALQWALGSIQASRLRLPLTGPAPDSSLAVCTSGTIGECKANLIFGLPAQLWCYVEYVRKG